MRAVRSPNLHAVRRHEHGMTAPVDPPGPSLVAEASLNAASLRHGSPYCHASSFPVEGVAEADRLDRIPRRVRVEHAPQLREGESVRHVVNEATESRSVLVVVR